MAAPALHLALALALVSGWPATLGAQDPASVPDGQPRRDDADDRSGILEGRIIDLRGEPVPSTRIEARSVSSQNAPVLAETRGDGAGVFRLRLPAGPARLWISATAPGSCWAGTWIAEDTTFVELTLHEAAVVRGLVRGVDGTPLAGVAVRAAHASAGLADADVRTQSDRQGRFALDKVPLGPVELSAWIANAGLATTSMRVTGDAEVELRAPDDPGVTMTIEVDGITAADLPALRLEVSSAAGVCTRRWAGPLDDQAVPPFAMDERGAIASLTLRGLPDADYRVVLRAPGYVVGPGTASGTGPHRVRLAASKGVRLEHQFVVDFENQAGKPLEGIELVLRGGEDQAVAVTDASGRAMFDTAFLSTAAPELEVRDPNWSVVNRQRLPTSWGRERPRYPVSFAPLRFVAKPAGQITGRVRRSSGEPAPFVPVEIQARSSSADWNTIGRTLTDRNGSYRFAQLTPATVRVRVACRWGHASAQHAESAATGPPIETPDLTLAEPVPIEGVVRDIDGRPAPGVLIQLAPHGEVDDAPVGLRRITERPEPLYTISDRQGRFRLFGPVAGDATLSARTLDGAEVGQREIEITAGLEPVDLKLPGSTPPPKAR